MDALAGLPDFQSLLSTEAVTAFAPFLGGSYAVVPQQATLARDASGNPKLLLELFEQLGDFSDTGSFAILDLTVGWDFPLDAALAAARATNPAATVRPLAIHRGFARLVPTTNEVTPTADLLAPVELGWLSPDGARWTPRISAAAGGLIKGSLSSGSLLLGVRLEFDAAGVAQRVPASVQFDPVALLPALLAGNASRTTTPAAVLAAFGSPSALPLKIVGSVTPEFAQAMADRIIATFATLVPAASATDPATVAFSDPATLATGVLTWDLSLPALAYRQWVLALDASSDLSAAVAKNGLDFFVKEIVAPPLEAGVYSIDVTANLPPNRSGVPAIGAYIQLAANPPLRPASTNESVTLSEPSDRGTALVHLSPAEPFGYDVCGFAVVVAGTSVQTYTAPSSRACTDAWVTLTAEDFPVSFAHITATDRLLALASVALDLTYTVGGATLLQHFALSAAAPSISLGIPNGATGASLQISATPSDGGPPLLLPPMAPGRFNLDLPLFAEYGPHRIDVSANLSDSDAALVLELQSEAQSADPAAVPDLLMLTPAQPSATWGYVAASPFHPGYRYRRSATSSSTPASAWSPVLPPLQPLLLGADGSLPTLTPGPLVAAQPSA